MTALLILGVIVVVAVIVLRRFDKIAGRGPKQIADGIRAADREQRVTPYTSAADELAKLTALHDRGALTREEFESAKARLLG